MISSNVWGLIVSYVGIFMIIGVAQLLLHTRLSAAATRKIIHIGVCHWWLAALLFFDSAVFAVIGPVTFIIFNSLSYRYGLIRSMEHPVKRRNLGTVYFPISLTILTLLVFAGPMPPAAATIAILVLGWGDGMGALIGEHMPAHKPIIPAFLIRRFPMFGDSSKTVAGSLAVLVASTLVSGIVLLSVSAMPLTWIALSALTIGTTAALVELVTPFGIDNLSVPLVIAGIAWILLEIGLDIFPLASETCCFLILPSLVNITVAIAAYISRAVNRSGAVVGFLTGTIIAAVGGWGIWALLMWFFLSSSIIGRFAKKKAVDLSLILQRDGPRDWIQVIANTCVPLLLIFVYAATRNPGWLAVAAGGISAATADTWSSEIGIHSASEPQMITNYLRKKRIPVPIGLSGGVTTLGFFAGAIAAAVTAVLSWLLLSPVTVAVAGLIAAAGLLGTVTDSLLGAFVQASYRDISSGMPTERPGTHNPLVRGTKWMNNDTVNAVSIFISSAALLLVLFFSGSL